MPHSKTIHIIPMSGLCNRMRAMASGVYVAKQLSRPAIVYWNKTAGCRARFDELFEPCQVSNIKVLEGGGILNAYPYGRRNLRLPLLLQRLYYDQVVFGFAKSSERDVFSLLKDVDDILLESQHSMCEHYPLRELFVPRHDIAARIAKSTAPFNEHTLGLHIRGTDNVKSREHSSLDKFIARIDRELSVCEGATFFLATDEPGVRKALIARYGARILFRDNVLSRSSVEGMQDAVADLWCLSRTQRIIGSYWSSYSEMAAEIGGIELEVTM